MIKPPPLGPRWLLKLRFFALAIQSMTIFGVAFGAKIVLPLGPLTLLLALAFLTNVVGWLFLRRVPADLLMGGMMVLDVLHLTALLYFTGGPFNPFSFLYLVLIALSAVVMAPRFTWGLLALAMSCSAILFAWHRPLVLPHLGHDRMDIHFYGMWVAFSISGGFTVLLLMRVTQALSAREEELRAAQRRSLLRDKLASLATLAAGAAHELATPLSTIAVVAHELSRQAEGAAFPESVVEDLKLIRREVERCRGVLSQMAEGAGEHAGEGLLPTTLSELCTQAQEGLRTTPKVRIRLPDNPPVLRLPRRALSQAVRALLKNAQDASQKNQAEVEFSATCTPDSLKLSVCDRGTGMNDETRLHIGEPFFTTKPPGQGMGLGLFLCRAVAEGLGGTLEHKARVGGGTEAILSLPLSDPATICRIVQRNP